MRLITDILNEIEELWVKITKLGKLARHARSFSIMHILRDKNIKPVHIR